MSYYHTPGYRTKLETAKTTFIIWGKYTGNKNKIPKITSVDGAKFSQGDNNLYLRDIGESIINDLRVKQQTPKGIENASFDLKIENIITPKIDGCGSLKMPDIDPRAGHYDNGLNIGEKEGGTFVAWGEMRDGMMSKVSGKFLSNQGQEFTVENAFKNLKKDNRRGIFYDIGTKQEDPIQFGEDIEKCMKELLGMNITSLSVDDDDYDDKSVQSLKFIVGDEQSDNIYGKNPMSLNDSDPLYFPKQQDEKISLANFMNSMKKYFEEDSSVFHKQITLTNVEQKTVKRGWNDDDSAVKSDDKSSDESTVKPDDESGDNSSGALNEIYNAQLYFLEEKEYNKQTFIKELIELENTIKNHIKQKLQAEALLKRDEFYQSENESVSNDSDKIDEYIKKNRQETTLDATNALVYHYSKENKSKGSDEIYRPNHLVIIFYVKENSIYYRITSSNIYSKGREITLGLTSSKHYSYKIVLDNKIEKGNQPYLYTPEKNETGQVIGDNSAQSLFQPVGDLTNDIKSFTIEPVFSYDIDNEGKINYTVSYFRIDRSDGGTVDTYLINFEEYKNFRNNLHRIQTINGNEVIISKDNHMINKSDQKDILYYHKIEFDKSKGGSNIRKRKTKHKRKRKNATLKK